MELVDAPHHGTCCCTATAAAAGRLAITYLLPEPRGGELTVLGMCENCDERQGSPWRTQGHRHGNRVAGTVCGTSRGNPHLPGP